ncbi:MAG: hypothetical protein EKK54_01350 [Neisseriaceae bacterium]|nr:MAG: hypothetical protein EKK54_01350 [Neisseriaceae bacterium]
MKYPLYDLDDTEFEQLVISICEEVLGTATFGFAPGKDGGRDAVFNGKANNFPSSTEQWSGKFIIQAKHTSKPNASCSDSDFKTILNGEIKRIVELSNNNKLDFYLMFTNRKLTGIQYGKIQDIIDISLDNISNVVVAEETIQKWLRDYPSIAKKHKLNKLLLPLQFYDEDLKNIIIAFSQVNFNKKKIQKIKRRNDKITIEEKNELNQMSESYFKNKFKTSFNDFDKIETFFKSPKNRSFSRMYDNTIDELQAKIIIKRGDYHHFEEVIEFLCEYMKESHMHVTELIQDRRLIRTFLHYMYYHCDIGITE